MANRKPVFQLTRAGLFNDVVPALESEREPDMDVWHVPMGAVERPMPADWIRITPTDGGFYLWLAAWPEDKWPRFNGHAWELVNRPVQPQEPTAAEKLAALIADDPRVADLIAALANSQTPSQEQ